MNILLNLIKMKSVNQIPSKFKLAFRPSLSSLLIMLSFFLISACNDGKDGKTGRDGISDLVTRDDVIKTNANIAYAVYSDSLITAIEMQEKLQALVNSPSETSFLQAKQAWLDTREPYGQSEVYRFRGGPIDRLKEDNTLGEDGDGPEGQINAWPLGEAIIDYVAPVVDGDSGPENSSNALTNNIIADNVNYPTISTDIILNLFEHGEDERNVTSGYHSIEFLLWGQDLNTDLSATPPRDSSGGQRPVTDYFTNANGNTNGCTSGQTPAPDNICVRRGEYLLSVAEILISDLRRIVYAWEPEAGFHYQNFVKGGDTSLAKILEGMGRLSFGELAGERINIALLTNSQEDEHSCFSDNTHRDIYLNAKGVQNSYLGKYTRVNGEIVSGASIKQLLVVENQPLLANEMQIALEKTMSTASVIDTKAKTGKPFDQLIQEGPEQKNILAVIGALVEQTDDIEKVIQTLGVTTDDLHQDTEEDI